MSALTEMLNRLPPSVLKQEAGTTQGKFLKPFADQLDELEAVELQLLTLLEIAASTNVNLDQLGKLLNQIREGWDDATYRVFLDIAIKKLASRGDIFSINEIAEALGFTNINVIEMYDGGGRLDGKSLLDATELLNGVDRPATFSFFQDRNVDDTGGSFEISTVVNAVRAAGVFAQISFIFNSNQVQGRTYSTYSSLLDASEVLDAETALNPTKMDLVPNKIAVGDGAVGEPGPGDTGLQNELLRKDVITFVDTDGKRTHMMVVGQTDLDGKTIDEFALFKDSSLMWADAFVGKVKDDKTIFTFKMKETD